MNKNQDRYTLLQYVTEHHPAILESYKAFKGKHLRKKRREYMRKYYKPTGNKPGRPRIDEEEKQD